MDEELDLAGLDKPPASPQEVVERSTRLGVELQKVAKQGSDLALSQSKAMEKQFATGLDTWHGMVTAQQQAALAMGRVFVDALKPTSANA